MDGLLLILFSWFIVSLICYFFILRYNRRRQSSTFAVFKERQLNGNENNLLINDVANWLIWGNGEKETTINNQFNCLITKSLNEASRRLQEQGKPEIHFDAVQINQGSASSALKDFHVRPNRSPGNHLSISGKILIENNTNQPKINLFVSLFEQQQLLEEDKLNKEEKIKKTSKIENSAVRNYEIIINEINGEAEVRLAQIANELFIIACFSGRPNICFKILEPTAEKAMENFVIEFTRKCLLGAVLNFSLGELLYPDEESTARATKARLSAEYRNLSFLQEPQRFPLEEGEIFSSEHLKQVHFLHIHLMELRELQEGLLNSTNERPFLCIELNEPSSERFLSPKAHLDAHSGNYWFWHDGEANFDLAISPTGGELLFELFTETPSYQNEKDNNNIDLPPTAIYGTVRQRRFLGMAILKISELRKTLAKQKIGSPVHLALQGKGLELKEEKNIKDFDQKSGILLFQSSFHERSLPLLKLNNPIATPSKEQFNNFNKLINQKEEQQLFNNNYNQFSYQNNQQSTDFHNKRSPTRSTKKGSIPSLGSLKKPKNQPHYIYNVTEDRLPTSNNSTIEKAKELQKQLENEKQIHYNIRSTTSPSDEESLIPKQSFDTTNNYYNNSPERQEKQINNTSQIRKTISDSNALLFKYEQNKNEINRKQSAPGTPQQRNEEEEEINRDIANKVSNNNNITQQPNLFDNQNSKEIINDQSNNANDVYDHLFNGMHAQNSAATATTHPAMEIFRLPSEKQTNINEDEDELRGRAKDRERQTRGRKEHRNFFEQIRARLSGPLKLFPGRHSKRAKSLDEYEQHLEEAAVSAPQSRDQSQHRKASSGEEEHNNRQQRLIQSAGPSSMTTSTANLISSRQQNILSKSNPQSQLILELIGTEDEGPTYYSIPTEISNEPAVVKLMQSGKKLHIQNSHILVAAKARGRVICSVCNKRIGGNFSSRQAYQCRECRIVCHKNCHQQIDWICENVTNLSNLHVEEVDWTEFLRHHQLREFISVGNL